MKKNKKKEVRKTQVKKSVVKKPQTKKVGGKKEKDPRRVEAAKKAWDTIRARTKAKQEGSKLTQMNS